jgi:hypothetical protein
MKRDENGWSGGTHRVAFDFVDDLIPSTVVAFQDYKEVRAQKQLITAEDPIVIFSRPIRHHGDTLAIPKGAP